MSKKLTTLIAVFTLGAPLAYAGPLKVGYGETRTITLSSAAEAVVIGDPAIADVAVHSPTVVLLTGKSFGTTSLTVLGTSGKAILSTEVMIDHGSNLKLTVTRAGGSETYSCTPNCQAAPIIGDSEEFFGRVEMQRSAVAAARTE